MVLPGAVGVRRAQHLFGTFQLLGALNEPDRRARAGVEAIPEGLVLRDPGLGELISFVDEACITDAEWTVPIIRHAVVAESVHVIDLEPVVARGEKIIAGELAIKVRALAEITEIILRERSHERVLAISEARVSVVICEVHTRVAVDDIHNYGDAVFVGDVHHLLEGGSLPESFVDAKVPDGKVAPVN